MGFSLTESSDFDYTSKNEILSSDACELFLSAWSVRKQGVNSGRIKQQLGKERLMAPLAIYLHYCDTGISLDIHTMTEHVYVHVCYWLHDIMGLWIGLVRMWLRVL